MITSNASLSIIIPAFNEGSKIARDIMNGLAFLMTEQRVGEIIVVDDGSSDDTATAAESIGLTAPDMVRVIRHGNNRGKGAALRSGVMASRYERVLCIDAGDCIPYDNARLGLTWLDTGRCDIAHGSRRLSDHFQNAVHASLLRRVLSTAFLSMVQATVPACRGLSDTQCGFKAYRGDVARRLYAQGHCHGWLVDVEMIVRAVRLGFVIREFPVTWQCDRDSRVHPFRDLAQFLGEAWRLSHMSRT